MNKEFTKGKILIIDDQLNMLNLMKDLLEDERYQVFCASNGSDGILLNEQENPDLILLDLRMPGMDGIETLRNIRYHDDKVRVAILTGYGCPDTIRDAANLDVSEYLSKPFKSKELVNIIRKALEL